MFGNLNQKSLKKLRRMISHFNSTLSKISRILKCSILITFMTRIDTLQLITHTILPMASPHLSPSTTTSTSTSTKTLTILPKCLSLTNNKTSQSTYLRNTISMSTLNRTPSTSSWYWLNYSTWKTFSSQSQFHQWRKLRLQRRYSSQWMNTPCLISISIR